MISANYRECVVMRWRHEFSNARDTSNLLHRLSSHIPEKIVLTVNLDPKPRFDFSPFVRECCQRLVHSTLHRLSPCLYL